MKNKKILALLLALVMSVSLLAGCGGNASTENPSSAGTNSPDSGSVSTENGSSADDNNVPSDDSGVSSENSTVDLTGQTLMIYCGAGM